MITLYQLLKTTVKQGASDLHIAAGSPPVLRVNGRMVRVKGEELSPADTKEICYSVLTDEQKAQLEENHELDLSFEIRNIARFRANMFWQRGTISGVFRLIPLKVPALESLNLPKAVRRVTDFEHGLVLVTGPTGSGKSTTIASILDDINSERRGHIVTIEDPIEYVHFHKKSIVSQREVGSDTDSFSKALKYILRQDPDVVLMGELRDLESIEAALNIAETGHLVFATAHTNSATEAISRLVGVFDGDEQERVRIQLSFVLNAVLSQRLVPSREGHRICAMEVLFLNSGIRNLIRENKLHQVRGMMQVGQENSGMQTMNQALLGLILKRTVDVRQAFVVSPDPDELDKMLKKAGV